MNGMCSCGDVLSDLFAESCRNCRTNDNILIRHSDRPKKKGRKKKGKRNGTSRTYSDKRTGE